MCRIFWTSSKAVCWVALSRWSLDWPRGGAGLFFSFIMAGSELMAEVCLDAFVVGMLYRHLKIAAMEHWLGIAVKRTWISALLTAGGLGLAGYFLGLLAPDTHSLGPALKAIFEGL